MDKLRKSFRYSGRVGRLYWPDGEWTGNQSMVDALRHEIAFDMSEGFVEGSTKGAKNVW